MIENMIGDIWISVIEDVINQPDRFSSEKSIVFHFAWKLKMKYNDQIQIDFEKQLYEKFSDGAFLDLFFEIGDNKFGIEFKFPRKSTFGNTNQTQTRIKIINDIKRLSYLVNKGKIDYGIFLLATNEKPYVFMGNKTISKEFQTYSKMLYGIGQTFPIDRKASKEEVICPSDIHFNWVGVDEKKILNSIAWIEPIIIHN